MLTLRWSGRDLDNLHFKLITNQKATFCNVFAFLRLNHQGYW